MDITQPCLMPLKGIYQQCIKTLEQLANVRVIINGVIVEVDFQVKNISDLSGGYSIILGRPWLRKVKAVNYCGKGCMVIGLEHDRVQLNVQPTSSEDSTSDIDGGFKTSSTSKWTSVSETNFDYENEIVAEVYELSSEPILENFGGTVSVNSGPIDGEGLTQKQQEQEVFKQSEVRTRFITRGIIGLGTAYLQILGSFR